MIAAVGSRLVILLFGTLYPAYASYKAVRNKDVKAYVQWMMYWIVFALFTCVETFSDVFLSFWVPFYYELKVIIVFWLLSPATKGSSLLYRKFVHPTLTEREREIDEYLAKMREKSYSTMLELGSKGINYALQTAIKGGGGLVNQLRKSYSLSDLSDRTDGPVDQVGAVHQQAGRRRVAPPQLDDSDDMDLDEVPMVGGAHRGYSPRRSASGSGRVEMYFPAADVDVRRQKGAVGDSAANSGSVISDGVDSGLEVENEPLVRTASLSSTRTSTRVRRTVTSPTSSATSPGTRTKSVATVAEVESASIVPQITSDGADLDSEPDSDSLTSPLTSEQVTVVPLQERPPSPPMVDASDELPDGFAIPNAPTETYLDTSSNQDLTSQNNTDEDVSSQHTDHNVASQNTDQDLKIAIKSDVTDLPVEETQILQPEVFKEVETNFVEVNDEPIVCETDEETVIPTTPDEKNTEIKPEDDSEKKIEESVLVDPLESKDVPENNKGSTNVLVTVEVSMPPPEESQTGPMIVRMSMESLPTSSQEAEAMDLNIPVTVANLFEEEVSLKSSCDSLASCSLPGTPNVSRSSSRVGEDARAGRYNKRAAPPRPNTDSTPSPDPKAALKARLVLQPGMVRSLPEAKGEASEVFLVANKDKRKKKQASGGISSIFPFWHSKPEEKQKESGEKVPMKAKMTNI